MARAICFKLFWHLVRAAASRTFWTAGSNRPIRIAMMAITTSNSISVNARRRSGHGTRMGLAPPGPAVEGVGAPPAGRGWTPHGAAPGGGGGPPPGGVPWPPTRPPPGKGSPPPPRRFGDRPRGPRLRLFYTGINEVEPRVLHDEADVA